MDSQPALASNFGVSVVEIVCVVLVAYLVSGLIPEVSPVLVALVVGATIANVIPSLEVDVRVRRIVLNRLLKGAVILLGSTINLEALITIGWRAGVVAISVLFLAFTAARVLAPRLGVDIGSSILLGAGTAICGASAIVAVTPLVGADEKDLARTLAAVLSLNGLGMILFPVIGTVLGMDSSGFGAWVGAAIHDTASAIGTGFAWDETAGRAATVLKLTRTVLLIPTLIVLGRGRGASQRGEQDQQRSFPWFVAGFVALAVASSVGIPAGMREALGFVAKALIVVVVATLGLGLSWRRHGIGSRSTFRLAWMVWILVAVGSFLLISITGL